MKTKTFPINQLIEQIHQSYDFDNIKEPPARIYKIPTLSAYAVQSSHIEGAPTDIEEASVGVQHSIEGDLLRWYGDCWMGLDWRMSQPHLRITYIGIKDYENLFPYVQPEPLKQRLAEMFEEADKAFENELWLSFTTIAGGVCEGILSSVLRAGKGLNFSQLINRAKENSIITEQQASTLDDVRKLRNIIHPNRYNEPNISRPVAMELRILIDELMRVDWEAKLKGENPAG
ncbi:hypothetical protein [Thalassomonas sp. RHCl1]|uniref:hypothetical protein n=1 Tax=Thalassomonas sp. RHCl1 TaxID=2995320 RepID=UPI00248C49CC|nr:hypothetical protein [Thalassomonas sp. RHCl1]